MDVEQVARVAAGFPGVVHSVAYQYMCSDPGQKMIVEAIKEKKLDRVVVASCSPHIQQPTFMRTLMRAGLNPYMFEMANLREHCAWVHRDREKATRKAIYRPFPQAVPSRFTIDKRGVSPCKATCPAETSAQGYVALIAEGRYEEALSFIQEYNPFPATVGRVCTHPCESACNRGKIDKPVAICALKRFVADAIYAQRGKEGASARPKPVSLAKDAKRVAILGAGPYCSKICCMYTAKHAIVAFLCNWCSYVGADLGTSRIQYPENIRIIRVPCSGRIDPIFVLRALQGGVDGVLISGCHPGDCHYTKGNYYARRRMLMLRQLLTISGIDSRRLQMSWVSASEGHKWAQIVAEVTAIVKELGSIESSKYRVTD